MQSIFDSVERGAVLVTSTRRLTRVLRQEFASWQRDRGRTVWSSPAILPLGAYVANLWRKTLTAANSESVLLTADQELLLWQQIIRASPEGDTLLQIEATAAQARQAWGLIHSYRLPLDGSFKSTPDCEAFLGWARAFESRLKRSGWFDAARLPDRILNAIRSGAIPHPRAAYYMGFDELTPQDLEFVEAIQAEQAIRPAIQAVIKTRASATAEDEIRCAATWAREILQEAPEARIGIVVPNLPQLRSKIDRIFNEVLGTTEAFHISLGKPLAEYAIVHAALELIRAAMLPPVALARLGVLLRSPFLEGAAEERNARAILDARLRRAGKWELSLDQVSHLASSGCRILSRGLAKLMKAVPEMNQPRAHSEWSRVFSSLLKAVGWPGDRPPNSHEHQILGRWNEMLSEFAALDAVSGPLGSAQAVDRLQAIAATIIFQFEDAGAPVQISDQLEIAGVDFDHLWAMGLHDEAFPPPADPNPFLPVSLQREHGLPQASAERQYRTSQTVFDRLVRSASEVVLSYPRMEADRALRPSPFLTAVPHFISAEPSRWIASLRARPEIEHMVDEAAPPLEAEGLQRGGAALLRDMAACPFRAFASHRLGATQPERIQAGLSARDKGKLLHQVLQLIWSDLGSHSTLHDLSDCDLTELVRRHIDTVLAPLGSSTNVEAERIRLGRLLLEWIKLERSRPPFTVAKVEEKKTIQIGGLCLEVRADRVDQLPGGRQLILDYKTGEVKTRGWTGERLDEPQLPLYCVSTDGPIAGAVFARIQAERIGFAGLAETMLPEFQSWATKNGPPLDTQFEEWRSALEQLAREFRSGVAIVDPKYADSCDYCAIVPLCRICDAP